MPRASFVAFLLAAVVTAACAEPPRKEMDQAQGAIDAARAAGAAEYAAADLKAATDALAKAEEAVTQNDYRLALNHALDSREQAQQAAMHAVSSRSTARGDTERVITEVSTLVRHAHERLQDAPIAALPARVMREPRDRVAAAETALQEAREALDRGEYSVAAARLDGQAEALRDALAAIDKNATPAPAPRRRRD